MDGLYFVLAFVVVIALSLAFIYYGSLRKKGTPSWLIIVESFSVLFFAFFFGVFAFFLEGSAEYDQVIDPLSNSYTFISKKYILTFLVFFFLSLISMWLLYFKGKNGLPPLLMVLCLVFLSIGIAISVAVIGQLTYNSENWTTGLLWFIMAPIFYLLISICILIKIIKEQVTDSIERNYKNKVLNWLNKIMANPRMQSIWVIILIFPVFAIIALILLIFGQDADSIVKGFTETTTWRFSEMEHPPYLDHDGHYLCTVAACGHHRVVKPIRYGIRHHNQIVVNRQLLVANAFEEKIAELSPAIHRFIRTNYDKYGYPLSKHINTPLKSDITYILMKPFEYIFLAVLYLTDLKPEQRINNQYKQ